MIEMIQTAEVVHGVMVEIAELEMGHSGHEAAKVSVEIEEALHTEAVELEVGHSGHEVAKVTGEGGKTQIGEIRE